MREGLQRELREPLGRTQREVSPSGKRKDKDIPCMAVLYWATAQRKEGRREGRREGRILVG